MELKLKDCTNEELIAWITSPYAIGAKEACLSFVRDRRFGAFTERGGRMTAQESLTILQAEIEHHPECSLFYEAFEKAIDALEKQIPKKPITYKGTNRADCPICNATVRGITAPWGNYCSECGQLMDWSDEDD